MDARAEQVGREGLALVFLERKGERNMGCRAKLGGKDGLALLLLAAEGWETHGIPELSWRVRRGWLYHFMPSEGGGHMGCQS